MKTESDSIGYEKVQKLRMAAEGDNPFPDKSMLSITAALYKLWEHRRVVARAILNGGLDHNNDAYALFERHNDSIKEIMGL